MGVGANRVTDNSAARTKRGNRWASREKGFQAEVGLVACYDNERGAPRVTPSVDRGLGIGDWGFDWSVRTSLNPHSSSLTPHFRPSRVTYSFQTARRLPGTYQRII